MIHDRRQLEDPHKAAICNLTDQVFTRTAALLLLLTLDGKPWLFTSKVTSFGSQPGSAI
jgi:flagellar biosynthesis protein FliR